MLACRSDYESLISSSSLSHLHILLKAVFPPLTISFPTMSHKRTASEPLSSSPASKKASTEPPPSSPPSTPCEPEEEEEEYYEPPSSPAGIYPDTEHTFHVFHSSFIWQHHHPCFTEDQPYGVFATREEANAYAASIVHEGCNEYAELYEDAEKNPEDYLERLYGHWCSEGGEDKHGLLKIRLESRGIDDSFTEAYVRANKCEDAVEGRKGEVWVLKVRGELVGVYDTRVGVVKAVVRVKERMGEMEVKMEKGQGLDGRAVNMGLEEMVAYVVVNDGLEVEAIRADDSKEVVITATKWDLMH